MLRRALEPFLGPRSLDDLVALAEPDARTFGPMCLPEPLEARLEVLQLLLQDRSRGPARAGSTVRPGAR